MDGYESEISSNLERAESNLQVARELFDRGYYDVCASRAYYAAFYSASALLLKKKIDTSKHGGVIALIHQHFVKSGILGKEQGRNLNWLFELRSVGDYGVSLHVAPKDARRAVDTASDFIRAVRALLGL
jgi:uncharacterized protein (UPF0332 family)